MLGDELEQRLAAALRARTYAELDPLLADLPGRAVADGRERGRLPVAARVLSTAVIVLAVLSVMAVAVMVITGLFAAWALWAIFAWWFFGRGRCASHRHSAHGALGLSHQRRRLL